jgi:hypothetical protein
MKATQKSVRNAAVKVLCLGLSMLCWSASGSTVLLNPTSIDNVRHYYSYPAYPAPFLCGWKTFGAVKNIPGNLEDRTFIDFDLRGLQSGPISSATLNFTVQLWGDDHGAESIDLFSFYGESTVQASDWDKGIFYTRFLDPAGQHTMDLTSIVQSAVNAGQSYLDLRMSTIDANANVFILSPSLTVVAIPEPSAFALLSLFTMTLMIAHRCRMNRCASGCLTTRAWGQRETTGSVGVHS